ncbi:hypothetical protein V5740_09345 [Croceibacterium sp. TMG7-5b_MA50]|uniref:hypothetical protein n=1 Tax=Croceibacterium sp. TMG7-5b_MA50 TaxID=3121290 RepID=UPI0032218386
MLFPVTIAGREVWGLIDNRSEFSVIDTALAEAADLEMRAPSGTFPGPTGRVEKRQVLDVPVAIPGQFDTRMPALAAVDLQPLSALHQREIGFVLGRNILSSMFLFLDTGQRSAKIMPGGSSRATGGPSPLVLTQGSNLVELEVRGGTERAVLDLALGAGIHVSPAAYARLQPDALPTTRVNPTRKLDGTVRIGPLSGRDPPLVIAPVEDGEAEIAIGLPMFRNSVLLIDFAQEKLWLLPSAPTRPVGEDASAESTPAAVGESPPGPQAG